MIVDYDRTLAPRFLYNQFLIIYTGTYLTLLNKSYANIYSFGRYFTFKKFLQTHDTPEQKVHFKNESYVTQHPKSYFFWKVDIIRKCTNEKDVTRDANVWY